MTDDNMIDDIFQGVQEIIEITSEDKWEDDKHALKYIADYYRHTIDNNKELFTAELPDYVGTYIATRNHVNIINMCESQNKPYYIMRDIIRYYRDAFYLYGYKKSNSIYETVDLTDYNYDITKDLLTKCNSMIENEKYTTQQIYLILKLTHEGYYRSNKDSFNTINEYLSFLAKINTEISNMYNHFKPTEKMDWNKFGGALDITYNELHHEALKDSAKKSIIHDIKNGDVELDNI